MKENNSPEPAKYQSFPQTHDLEERLQPDYDILNFARATASIRDGMVPCQQEKSAQIHMGNLPEKLGQKIYELLHREGSVPTEQVSAILEQLDKQPITTSPKFFNPDAAKVRLIEESRQLQFEKDCLEAGIDPREAEFQNFGEIISPKTSLIPFPKDEGLIAAISFIAITVMLVSAVILDYFF
jgi:hypothetical protein